MHVFLASVWSFLVKWYAEFQVNGLVFFSIYFFICEFLWNSIQKLLFFNSAHSGSGRSISNLNIHFTHKKSSLTRPFNVIYDSGSSQFLLIGSDKRKMGFFEIKSEWDILSCWTLKLPPFLESCTLNFLIYEHISRFSSIWKISLSMSITFFFLEL